MNILKNCVKNTKPSLYLYNNTHRGFELSLGEYSTLKGLSVFNEATDLSIISFGATGYKKQGWTSENELPPFAKVESVIKFLKSEGDIGIIDFKASLPEFGTFSTHDDGECHYIMKSKHQCISILKAVIPAQYSDMLINKLIDNPGFYFACDKVGTVTKYGSFNEYIEKSL